MGLRPGEVSAVEETPCMEISGDLSLCEGKRCPRRGGDL